MWSDILKRPTTKVIGSIFKKLLLEHVEKTGYKNEYIIYEVIDSIFDEYKELHAQHFNPTGLKVSNMKNRNIKTKVMKEKMNVFFGSSFPEGYERKQGFNRLPSKMVKLNQLNKLLKRNWGIKSNKVIGSIFRKLLLEHVEKTSYQDEYIIEDVINSIINEYEELHAQHINPTGQKERRIRIRTNILKEKMNMFFASSFPEGYERVEKKDFKRSPTIPAKMVKLNQLNKLLKRNLGKKSNKIIGSIFKKLLIEHVEKTGYEDEYIIEDVIENIIDEYIKLHTQHLNPEGKKWKLNIVPSTVKDKMTRFFGRSFPEGYKRIQGKGKHSNKMVKLDQQKDLEKLKTSSGENLKLRDWENFKSRLRRNLRAEVPLDKYGRRTNVRLVDGEDRDGKIALNVSFRAKDLTRKYVHVFFQEQEGDYFFTTVEGDIQLSDNEVFNSESELRNRITDMVIELVKRDYEERDLRDKDEEELTEEENIRQLEIANPDSQWDKEKAKLVPREISIEDQESRDLNLREAAELGSKMKEVEDKKRKLLQAQKNLKDKTGKLKPSRGKRGRRDVS